MSEKKISKKTHFLMIFFRQLFERLFEHFGARLECAFDYTSIV